MGHQAPGGPCLQGCHRNLSPASKSLPLFLISRLPSGNHPRDLHCTCLICLHASPHSLWKGSKVGGESVHFHPLPCWSFDSALRWAWATQPKSRGPKSLLSLVCKAPSLPASPGQTFTALNEWRPVRNQLATRSEEERIEDPSLVPS